MATARGHAQGAAGVQAGRGPRVAFSRDVVLAGWSRGSTWGYDVVLECYWAELWREDPAPRAPGGSSHRGPPEVRIGPEHLITTVTGLARAIAHAVEVADVDAYLALTA